MFFFVFFKIHIMKVNGCQKCLATNIVLDIFFCVLQKKESHVLTNTRVSDSILKGYSIFFGNRLILPLPQS